MKTEDVFLEMEKRKFPKSVKFALEVSEEPEALMKSLLKDVLEGRSTKEIVRATQPTIRKHLEMD